jgi:glycosyl transferase family 25
MFQMDHIEKVVYINLDRRTDRRKEIEEELTRLGIPSEKWIRFSAIEQKPGFIGCTKSHRAVLQMAKDAQWSNVLILEDDFMAVQSSEAIHQQLQDFFESTEEYDVLFLSHNIQRCEPLTSNLVRVFEAQTASGYLVHSRFYEKLLNNLTEASQLAEKHPHCHWLYINDQYWKSLQKDVNNTWLAIQPCIGVQRAGFSDLAERHVDYGV